MLRADTEQADDATRGALRGLASMVALLLLSKRDFTLGVLSRQVPVPPAPDSRW